ncbi:SGNH/GDSL hydrolase family protein [uncultured Microbacterium sp.]|uniref:SGNH/GDSL hydrolase family protein n=1 Tax=uncultured Microbacterium sp. TaxID=191216 RepID=UPI0028D0E1EB|nr:SGNH/GDSL hydrolase family protein [uncultured Microbacterium sp.]
MSAHPRPGRRGLRSSAAVAIALLALIFGVTAPAYAAKPTTPVVEKYVSLGDSYAAGQGASDSLDSCQHTAAAYPVLLDAAPGINLLRTPACSGATIADVTATQLSQVNRGTTLVTLTVGANDVGAGAIYTTCSVAPTSDACEAALDSAQEALNSGLIGQDLFALIRAIAERAPNARIIVTDYPLPFKLPSNEWIPNYVDGATAILNDQIAGAVAAAAEWATNVELASVADDFVGHQVGNADPWLGANPADPITFLHPTAAGQAAYRDAILWALAN